MEHDKKQALGGNTILAVSMAAKKLSAKIKKDTSYTKHF